MQTQHDDRDEIVGAGGESGGVIDLVHDQDLLISEARLSLEAGLAQRGAVRWGLSLMVPVRVIGTQIRYLDERGAEVELLRPGIHHRNETVRGLGDPMVLGVGSVSLADWRLSGRAGFTVPLGRTEEDPFQRGEQGLAHQHIQLGTGAVSPVLGAEVARRWGDWRFGAFALTQQALYENAKGYQAGDRYAGGVVASRALGARWSVRGGVEAQGETAERWGGTVHTDDGNRGRFDLLAGAAAAWAASEHLGLELAVKVPVVTRVVGGQLKMPAIVELSAAWSFGAAASAARPGAATDEHEGEDEHDHGAHDHDAHDHDGDDHGAHDHDERAAHASLDTPIDTTGLDVAELGPAGSAAPLQPAPGKQLTIVDFWAPWCEPCKLLEPELIALLRAYPDRLALRRLDIVDWDSAAAARYLVPAGTGIPHVKVLDATGAIVLERTTDRRGPAPLVEAIRALLEPKAAPPP